MLGGEDSGRDGDQERAEADPDGDAERGRGERVEPALGRERADELRRRMPTARAIPSSVLRSAASITNRFTSNSSPARMPKLPIAVNIDVNPSPTASAASSVRCFTG